MVLRFANPLLYSCSALLQRALYNIDAIHHNNRKSGVFEAEGGGGGGAADEGDEGGKGHEVGEGVEKEGIGPFDAKGDEMNVAYLELALESIEESEEERADRRPEGMPLAEDDGCEGDKAFARRHVG